LHVFLNSNQSLILSNQRPFELYFIDWAPVILRVLEQCEWFASNNKNDFMQALHKEHKYKNF
jgi:hypothetical protein